MARKMIQYQKKKEKKALKPGQVTLLIKGYIFSGSSE